MSEEEKKAIESLRIKATYIGDNYSFGVQGIKDLRNELNIALNLIEKQNEKIEQLKKQNEDLYEDNIVYHNIMMKQNRREYRSKFLKEFQEEYGINSYPDYDEIYKRYYNLKNNSIPKSVIREKIEELEKAKDSIISGEPSFVENVKIIVNYKIAVLKELLGEE